jgi:diadenylate cyclase
MDFQDTRWLLDILDVAIVTFLIYHIFLLVRGTRAAQMFLGLIAILLLSALADLFRLTALNWILASLKTVWVVAFLILFQPELRRGLTMIGHSRLFRRIFRLEEGSHLGEIEDALLNLRRRGLGAIVVLERNTGLRSYIETGTVLESNLSAELLETIFMPPAPLHDGAVIIRGNHVMAAGCILPLSQSMALDRSLGTRHRAILGVSEETDAIAIAVSEETRQIAIAEGGRLIRNVDPTTLKAVLSQFIRAPKEREERKEEKPQESAEAAVPPVAAEERRRSPGVAQT